MIHICFSLHDETGLSAKFAGTAILSAFENIFNPLPSVTVHILHDNTLTDDNREKFSYLAGHYNQLVKFYNVEELCADKLAQMINLFPDLEKARFNKAMFYKFLAPQILPKNLNKVIYLEPNVIVNLDLSELWQVKLGNNLLAAVPALEIGSDLPAQDKAVSDGFLMRDDYFSSAVMVMNLSMLRSQEHKILDGMKFINEHKYLTILDQTLLNWCFANWTVKLPAKFNCFVRLARTKKESVAEKIYCYTIYSLQLDMSDQFNALWFEYFVKTPWFDAATLGKLFAGFQQIHVRLKKSMANLVIAMNGKARGFCATPNYVAELKKNFRVRNDEEFITLENQKSLQKLVDAMKKSHGKKIFFIMAQGFPLNLLTKAGFTFGVDYLNALEFLSEEQGMSMNSYPLIHAM